MLLGTILWVVLGQSTTAHQHQPAQIGRFNCAQALPAALSDGAVAEICAGDEATKRANAALKESSERERQLRLAAEHYRKAATSASKLEVRVLAFNSLADVYDATALNDPREMDAVLRELIRLTPNDLAPVFRLAELEEDQGLTDSAEEILLDARRQHANTEDVYRMLGQFYARRVTALHKQTAQTESKPSIAPGERDENGVYRIGGSVPPPSRLDMPKMPPEAAAAGITGVVMAEIVVDTSGNVTDAKVVQSIPLLDEAALQAVRNWHYTATMVNGEPVPVRMNVTVNFTLASPSQRR